MNASFDGMRRKSTADMNYLHVVLQRIILVSDIGDYELELLKESYNSAAQSVDMMNCLHDDSVDGDMNDLSHLGISRFEQDEQTP